LHISIIRPKDSYDNKVLSDPTPPDSPPNKWTDNLENNDLSWHPWPPPASQANVAQHRRTTTIPKRVTPPVPSTKKRIVISKIITQNAHGLRCRPCNFNGKPLPHDPHDYTRYKHLITTMKLKQLDVYFVQETWLKGNIFDEVINGYHVFCHNGKKGKHNLCGVIIILSPRYHNGWKYAGACLRREGHKPGVYA
jgi:hypothetical protein